MANPPRMQSPSRRLLTLAMLAAALFVPMIDCGSFASAQEVRPRRSILDVILGNPAPRKPRERGQQPSRPRTIAVKPSSSIQSVKTKQSPPAIAKKADARPIVVIGDFMAAALADGLSTAYSGDPGITVIKETDGSSGLVRDDHLDWPTTLAAKIAKHKPAIVVIMLGSNDRQAIEVNGGEEKFRSDAWIKDYQDRVDRLASAAASANVPVIWTGLPSFQSPSLSADAATLNNIYRTRMEAAGATFIDIWDGFADENGKFIATGSDVNGQPVRLRGSDGLSLTKAGKRKMAFYLEKDIERILGGGQPELTRLDSTGLPLTQQPAEEAVHEIVSVPPVSLADPELDGASQLLDTALLPKTAGKSPRDLLIEKGETVKAPSGRMDDFSWPETKKPAG